MQDIAQQRCDIGQSGPPLSLSLRCRSCFCEWEESAQRTFSQWGHSAEHRVVSSPKTCESNGTQLGNSLSVIVVKRCGNQSKKWNNKNKAARQNTTLVATSWWKCTIDIFVFNVCECACAFKSRLTEKQLSVGQSALACPALSYIAPHSGPSH